MLAVARTPAELSAAVAHEQVDLVIVDLTMPGCDYDGLFRALESAGPQVPVLGYTTHVLARETQPLHGRCTRVVTREALTRQLGDILTAGIAA